MAGRNRSAPMHTPTTTTRENIGAPVMMSSITPGTPTHSKITGGFGLAPPPPPAAPHTPPQGTGGGPPSRLGRPPDPPPGNRQAPHLLHRPHREVQDLGNGAKVTAIAG